MKPDNNKNKILTVCTSALDMHSSRKTVATDEKEAILCMWIRTPKLYKYIVSFRSHFISLLSYGRCEATCFT